MKKNPLAVQIAFSEHVPEGLGVLWIRHLLLYSSKRSHDVCVGGAGYSIHTTEDETEAFCLHPGRRKKRPGSLSLAPKWHESCCYQPFLASTLSLPSRGTD